MSDRTQDLKNLRAVATACKNYVDETKEQILWQVGQYDITTQDDNTTAYQKVVPTGATRCKIKRIYGLTQKLNPTTASDNTSYSVKTMPATVYDFDISKVEGNSEKSENLITTFNSSTGTSHTFVDGVLTSSVVDSRSWNTYNICDFQVYLQAGTYYFKLFDINIDGSDYQAVAYCDSNNTSIGSFSLPTYTGKSITISTAGYYGFMLKFKGTVKPMLVKGSTEPTTYKQGFTGIHNFEWNGVKVYDSDNVEQVSKTIDLSSILYNGSPLFEGNAIKKLDSIVDYITPYKAHKAVGKQTTLTITAISSLSNTTNTFYAFAKSQDIDTTLGVYSTNNLCDKFDFKQYNNNLEDTSLQYKLVPNINQTSWYLCLPTSLNYTIEQAQALLTGATILYPLATPIEVSINWASLLRGITGYSNGTISLLNTNNQDTANLITYNSIIKENCCAKMVQSRGGNVVKTINLPTQASDGYSAVSVANIRDFTTNKRETNVSKNSDLGAFTWGYTRQYFWSTDIQSLVKTPQDNSYAANAECKSYSNYPSNNLLGGNLRIAIQSGGSVVVNDTRYDSNTTFKTAMTNEPLYYELADASKTETSIDSVDNVIEVQPGDELAFYDANDNLVTIQSDLTYRIEVAR